MLTVACEKTDADGYAAGEGGVVMNLVNTRAVDMSDQTLADCTTFIYQKGTGAEASNPTGTLIRKYAPGDCPATIKLLAGSYSVKVQWGERPAAADFEKCFYEGSADFTITAGQTEHVEVSCKPQSTVVEIVYDSNIAQTLSDYSVEVALPDDQNSKTKDALTFTENGMGYFTLPEGVTTLDWSFSATHSKKGEIHKSGQITNVEAGKKYTLTFKYSPDLPGYISIGIEIDETTDNHNDVCVFSQDPMVILQEQQDFTSESLPEGITVTMKATADDATVKAANIYLGGEVVWTWTVDGEASDANKATAVLSEDKKELIVTFLSRNFLAPGTDKLEAGKTNYRFEVVDTNDSKADKTMTVRIEGICPVSESDYDLWTNGITLHVISFDGVPTCKIQRNGSISEWAPTKVETTVENEYTVTFTPEWEESDNTKAGVKVYQPKEGRGIFANNSYTASAAIGGKTYDETFTPTVDQSIPNGDMTDTSCSCFTTENKETVFWGSGNNNYAKELCASGTKSGRSCAHLKSTMAGAMGITLLASGNLFTGTFYRPSLQGTVSFGQKYDWKARPTKLSLKYHATVGAVNQQKYKKEDGTHPLEKGAPDKGIIYVAIVDWSQQHGVESGAQRCSGMWSPDEKVNPGEGPIIGYGIFEIDKSTEGDDLKSLDIPIYYYDKKTKPSGAYTLVISCATNIYGDYMCGCDSNELWVTDFEWGY